MFIIAYPIDEGFLRNPLLPFVERDAKFRQLHDVLAAVFDDPQIQLAMRHDLLKTDSQALWNGRPATPLVVTGCLAVVRRLMSWSYRVLAEQVNASVGWRWVCQVYQQPLPNFRTICDREALLKPKTLSLIQAKVVHLGQAAGVTTGTRLRVDSSVTESDIHYPTDSSLLNDAARVLSRLVRQAREVLHPRTPADKVWFRDRHRQARRLARQIGQLARKGRKNAEKSSLKLSRQLLQVVAALVAQVAYLQPRLARSPSLTALGLQEMLSTYLPLVQRVIDQTERRVLHGQSVAASDKVVSLFDAMSQPHRGWVAR
jgi:transposase, IS5 family